MWNSILRAYLYSSLHIALVGAWTYYLLNITSPRALLESISIGILIYSYYNLSRILRIRNFEAIQGSSHLKWVSKNLTEIIITLGFSFLFLVLIGSELTVDESPQAFLILLGVLYFFLRDKPFLKNIIIAKTWCLAFSLFGHESNDLFAYFLALSIWYDFKDDVEYDYSKIILFIIVIIVAGVILANKLDVGNHYTLIFIAIHLLIFMVSLKIKNEFVYLFTVDMMMALTASSAYVLLKS